MRYAQVSLFQKNDTFRDLIGVQTVYIAYAIEQRRNNEFCERMKVTNVSLRIQGSGAQMKLSTYVKMK